MPKRSLMRKKSLRKSRGYRNYKCAKNLALEAWKGVKMLKGLVNVENKMFTVAVSQSVANTGVVLPLAAIPAGDDVDTRNGNSILGKYWSWRFRCAMNASASHTTVRLMCFVDKANQGVDPSPSDVLEALNVSAPMNVDNTDRFTILYDKQFTLNITANQEISGHAFRKLNFHLKYTGVTNADYSINQIYMLLISDEPTNLPGVDGYSRIGFYDN